MRFEQVPTVNRYGIFYTEDKHSPWEMKWYMTVEEMDDAVKRIMDTGWLQVSEDKSVAVRCFLRVGGDGMFWRYPSPKAVAQ